MNTKTLILLFLTFPVYLIGQNNSSIDLITGIEYSYRTVNSSNDDELTNLILDYKEKEIQKLNWRIGINYNRKLVKNFYIKSGIRLASVGYKREKETELRWGSEFDPITGEIIPDPNLPHEVQFFFDYLFIEVPIIGRVEFSNKKIIPFVEFGVSPNIYLTTRTTTKTDLEKRVDYDSEKASNFNKLHFVGSISFGANYQLKEKLQLFGQPIFRYHLTKMADASVKERLFNYGIELGVRRMLD